MGERREGAPREREAGLPARFAMFTAAAGLVVVVVYLLASPGLIDPDGHVVGRDFLNLRIAGELLNDGRMQVLFDSEAYLAALRSAVGDPDYPIHNWSYPPLLFPLAQGVAALPYPLALILWQGAGIAAVVAAARMAGPGWRWGCLIALSPAGIFALLTGQNGLFTAALIAAGLALGQHRRPGLAGLAWAVLAAKPHLGVPVLPMLLVQRRFGVIVRGGVILALAIGASILAYGFEPWRLFLIETAAQQRAVVEQWAGSLLHMMPTFFIQGRLWGLETGGAYALHAASITIALPLLVRALPRDRDAFRDWLTWLVLATFLILPYSFIYDMVIWQFMLVLWRTEPGRLFGMEDGRGAGLAWILAWALPLLAYVSAAQIGFQPLPFFLLWLLWRRTRAAHATAD